MTAPFASCQQLSCGSSVLLFERPAPSSRALCGECLETLRVVRIGLLGLGLDTYWPQFEGLRDRLEGYLNELATMLDGANRNVVRLGLVDSPEKALEAGHTCRTEDIDLLLIYATTYALSSTVLPVVLRARVPVILLNLQPEVALDYETFNAMSSRRAMTGEWLAWCSSCPVPELANVLRRLSIPFHQVTGMLRDDVHTRRELEHWLKAAEVRHALQHSRLGLMGHYYSGMLDVATDLVQVSGRFGTHVEMIEVDQLSALRKAVTPAELETKLGEFDDFFRLGPECVKAEQERAARTAVALDHLVSQSRLNMLAYYHKGSGIAANEDTMSSIILGASMLTARGVSVAGEYEVKNVLAMQILHLLGAGGSFSEYYAADFAEDVVLMGHDGPGHAAIAQDRIRVRPLQVYHGKVGQGLSVEMAVQYGSVTLLSIVEDRECGFQLLVAEGESVAGPVLQIGNTNSRYSFPIGARAFMERWNSFGPAHHCAIGVGHHADVLSKLANLLQMPFQRVC